MCEMQNVIQEVYVKNFKNNARLYLSCVIFILLTFHVAGIPVGRSRAVFEG